MTVIHGAEVPVMHNATWHVWTSKELQLGATFNRLPKWCWAAYGPRGSQSGVEIEAQDAINKAHAAMFVLDDVQRKGPNE